MMKPQVSGLGFVVVPGHLDVGTGRGSREQTPLRPVRCGVVGRATGYGFEGVWKELVR